MGRIYRIVLLILNFVFILTSARAQLCQGSLGDPIVNITFGSGANPGPSLAAATTAYQYIATDCPNDGYYTVRNNTINCFGNTWHTLGSDHTGNPNGYFMLVNASLQPSAFYIDTVHGLCSNVTFEFAAWILNVMLPSGCNSNSIQPNLTFNIEKTDGTVLQTYNTGNIPTQSTPTWQQVGFFFTTPVGVSDVVLRITNNATGGCGNDLALDDITFRPCGPQILSGINGISGNSDAYCEGPAHSYTFTSNVSAGYTNPSFQWQENINNTGWTDIAGANGSTLTKNFPANAAPGVYQYRLSAAESGNMSSPQCRVASTTLTITINANPVTSITTNSPLCANNDLQLTATGGEQYQWTGVNGFNGLGSSITIPNAQPVQSGRYYLLVTSPAGCTHPDSADVVVHPVPVAATNISTASICAGQQVQLMASGGTQYSWTPSAGLSSSIVSNPLASPADTTQYMLVVSNNYSCTDTAYVLINVAANPAVNAGPDRTIIAGNSTQLNGTVAGQDINYYWSPILNIDNPHSLTPIVNPSADIDYILQVFSNVGCGSVADTAHVFVYHDVYVPSAFTPNNDGRNDTWYIKPLDAFSKFEVSVYNRYGQLVFHTKDINKGWDGTFKGELQGSGTYVYIISLDDGKRMLKGTFILIR